MNGIKLQGMFVNPMWTTGVRGGESGQDAYIGNRNGRPKQDRQGASL
mgnify:FL=1